MISRCRCHGFTLLEVLVAFTILVLLLGALLHVFSSGLNAARVGQQHTRATLIAQSKLAELASKDVVIEGVQHGQDQTFRWQTTVVPYEEVDKTLDELSVQPWEVTVEVSWQDGSGSRSIALGSMLLGVRQ